MGRRDNVCVCARVSRDTRFELKIRPSCGHAKHKLKSARKGGLVHVALKILVNCERSNHKRCVRESQGDGICALLSKTVFDRQQNCTRVKRRMCQARLVCVSSIYDYYSRCTPCASRSVYL